MKVNQLNICSHHITRKFVEVFIKKINMLTNVIFRGGKKIIRGGKWLAVP